MERVINKYKESLKKHGYSTAAQLDPKNRNDLRFSSLVSFLPHTKAFTLLDYGCGLAFLEDYLQQTGFTNCIYHGVDIVENFIAENRNRNPQGKYDVIKTYSDVNTSYDYISLFSVFNLLYDSNAEEQEKTVQETIKHLFGKTNVCLCVNFMTDQVDFVQDEAYHQNIVGFYDFAFQKLNRRLIIDQSYLPYEFTMLIFKDQERQTDINSVYARQL
jgi:SAM-dependent methyltransferase